MVVIPTYVFAAATVEVKVDDDEFISRTVSTSVGSSVHWSRAAGSDGDHNIRQNGDHNIRQNNGIFASGAPTDGPINFTKTFSAGTFAYQCDVHGSSMSGTVKVKPKISAAPPGRPFTVTWASASTDTGAAFDVRYKVGSGTYRTWKNNTSALKGVFGTGGSPVNVRSGKNYTFQGRSQTSNTAVSGWSPVSSFKA
nr:hypothetical protein [Actinomycetota bacterium]